TQAAADLESVQTTLANADKALGVRIDSTNTKMSNDKTEVTGLISNVASSVSTLQGNVNTQITNLESSVNNKLGNKLDASVMTSYYTRSETNDEIERVSAGKIEEFRSTVSSNVASIKADAVRVEDWETYA